MFFFLSGLFFFDTRANRRISAARWKSAVLLATIAAGSGNTMAFTIEEMPGTAFLALPGAGHFLAQELEERLGLSVRDAQEYGDLLYFPALSPEECAAKSGGARESAAYWSACTLYKPLRICFGSVGEAASALRSIQRNWAFYPLSLFRRGSLILQKLPYIHRGIKTFPYEIPASPMGFFCLLDRNAMLASAATSSPLPLGLLELEEDHENPPSRAYRKLQEALCRSHFLLGSPFPAANERGLDAGACPGGWTWVLAEAGCSVLAVDRTPLHPSLMRRRGVSFLRHDAFTLPPQELGEFDWVLSDVICYPERLLDWVHRWLDSGLCRRMICTVKMQGAADWGLLEEFARLPDSRLIHLNTNKHELTFLHVRNPLPGTEENSRTAQNA